MLAADSALGTLPKWLGGCALADLSIGVLRRFLHGGIHMPTMLPSQHCVVTLDAQATRRREARGASATGRTTVQNDEMAGRSADAGSPLAPDPYLVRLDECKGDRGYRAIALVGMMMLLFGCFNLVEGLAAIGNPHFFTTHRRPIVSDLASWPRSDAVGAGHLRTWGWVAVAMGLTEVTVAFGLPVKEQVGRWIGVIVLVLSATVQVLTFATHPFWSLGIGALDIVAISVLIAYGKSPAPTHPNRPRRWVSAGQRTSQWQTWRLSAQQVMLTWNEWLADDGRHSRELYRRHMAALAEEEQAAAELAKARSYRLEALGRKCRW